MALTALGDTLQGLLGRDPIERGRVLYGRGETERALQCFSRSGYPAAATLLSEIAREDQCASMRVSAISALAQLARGRGDAKEDAISALLDLSMGSVRAQSPQESILAAVALRAVLREQTDTQLLERVSAKAGALSWSVEKEPSPPSSEGVDGCNVAVCILCGGLRDRRSAKALASVTRRIAEGAQEVVAVLGQWVLDSIDMRPSDPKLDAMKETLRPKLSTPEQSGRAKRTRPEGDAGHQNLAFG